MNQRENGNHLSYFTGVYKITMSLYKKKKKRKESAELKSNSNNKVRYNPELN